MVNGASSPSLGGYVIARPERQPSANAVGQDMSTGTVTYNVPQFSYAVVASNAAGRAKSSVVTVTVTSAGPARQSKGAP